MKSEKKVYCQGGGCAAKLGPEVLGNVLKKLPKQKFNQALLCGYDNNEDASVYIINDDQAIISTLDFFPPMVSNPFLYGQIAACNALSDIYAMGGKALTAMNIVCFPPNEDLNVLGEILEGSLNKLNEAGVSLVGGHSIEDKSIKYGLSVNGIIHPQKIYRNNTPGEGELIVLTKKIGTGMYCAAYELNLIDDITFYECKESMTLLNKYVSEVVHNYQISAMTDITGFGLACHLLEMLAGKYCAKIYYDKLQYFSKCHDLVNSGILSAGSHKNRMKSINNINFAQSLTLAEEEVLFDPQTSGGLMMTMKEKDYIRLQKEFPYVYAIGEIISEHNMDYGKNKIYIF